MKSHKLSDFNGSGLPTQLTSHTLTLSQITVFNQSVRKSVDEGTISQLQDVFADTFMLAVMSQHPKLEVPIPGLSAQVLRASYQYIQAFFDEMA